MAESIIEFTLPYPSAVPEGTIFGFPHGNTVNIHHPMDVWEGDELFTCSWETHGEDGYIMVMKPANPAASSAKHWEAFL